MKAVTPYLLIGLTAFTLTGCLSTGSSADGDDAAQASDNGGVSGQNDEQGRGQSDVRVAFNPAEQVLPFPNNLLFEADANSAEDLDGTLNVPVDDPQDSSAPVIRALNTLDGFSTTASWRMAFTGDVDPDSLVAGETVRVFRMKPSGEGYPERTRPTEVDGELSPDQFRVAYDEQSNEMRILPAEPLSYDTTYTAVITEGVLDPSGDLVGSPLQWSVATGTGDLDQCDDPSKSDSALLQCTTNAAITPIEDSDNIDLDRDDMLLAWGVTTQRPDATFMQAADFIQSNGLKDLEEVSKLKKNDDPECKDIICLVNLDEVFGEEAPSTPGGKAKILPGTIHLPYGLEEAEDRTKGSEANGYEPTPARDDRVLETAWECSEGNCNADDNRGSVDGESLIRSVQTAPVIMAVPDPEAEGVPEPEGDGYPVVIFQHAIKQNRSNALAVADRLAQEGFAVVGIDMPLHGLVKSDIENESLNDLYAPAFYAQLQDSAIVYDCFLLCDEATIAQAMQDSLPQAWERTQYLDLVDEDGNPGSDGSIDSSGSHFLNPSQPLTQRDNIRQGSLDLVTLAHHLRSGDVSECGTKVLDDSPVGPNCDKDAALDKIDTTNLHFVGHSVGNIVAAPFLTHDEAIQSVTMLTPPGGIMRTLEGSASIGPQLREGLAESGIEPGTEDYYRFFASVQAALDSVDPLNHAPAITRGQDNAPRPVYLSQILGNDGSDGSDANPADLVLPPGVEGQPLAGSTALAKAADLTLAPSKEDDLGSGSFPLGQDYARDNAIQATVGFRFGAHASPLQPLTEDDDPRDNGEESFSIPNGEATHAEMQNQIASFLTNARDGNTRLTIGDLELVEAR
ncbi:virulence factor lipase-like protein [Halospina denitrificans]|uniref:Virulence factor lipase-like protein n=1 Tax=Halospina denitrificans TaxID=332522 RepID=A0A4R7JIP7_9GAMM|nr:Ig-like domain-containing protein [Halospina denitrificans]TDT37791.1 virulence factor lipase-like protein [Halospina denitrificans]